MTIQGKMNNITLLLRASLGKGNARAVLIVRHLQLAHLLGYVGLSDEYDEGFYEALADKYMLHTAAEKTAILKLKPGRSGGVPFCEVVAWLMTSVHSLHKRKEISDIECDRLLQQIMQLRGCMLGLYDQMEQPIPFAYYNLLVILLLVYMPLSGWVAAMGDGTSWFSLNVVATFLINSCLVGLLTVSQMLACPFGKDIQDFRVKSFIEAMLKTNGREIYSELSFDEPTEQEGAFMQACEGIARAAGFEACQDTEVQPIKDL